MRSTTHLPALALLGIAATVALAGCSSSTGDQAAAAAAGGRIAIAASTSVYAQIAEEVGGDLVDATAIVTSASQDPHSFEPSARDQLTVGRADLIIENGGGYDAYMSALVEASGSTAPTIVAVELSPEWKAASSGEVQGRDHEDEHDDEDEHLEDEHDHEHLEGFNEHVWYDPATMASLADAIAAELSDLAPEHAGEFTANAESSTAATTALDDDLHGLAAEHSGVAVFATEPVPLALVAAAGLTNLTPDAFSEAVEEGQDVPPATLLDALGILRDGAVRVVLVNTQTGGPETLAVIDEADAASIPIVEFTETLPDGETYLGWMTSNIDALAQALEQ
jgi:zinc/manganese transport system substrate-binding protein